MTKTADLTRDSVRPNTGLKQPQEATNWLAAFVSSSTDAIIGKTCDGVVTSFNPAAERLFGYRAEEIIGKPIRILIPADRQGEEDCILARIAAGECVEDYELSASTRMAVLLTYLSPSLLSEMDTAGS